MASPGGEVSGQPYKVTRKFLVVLARAVPDETARPMRVSARQQSPMPSVPRRRLVSRMPVILSLRCIAFSGGALGGDAGDPGDGCTHRPVLARVAPLPPFVAP